MFSQSIDQGKTCCPFNKTHIFAKQKLIFHLNRCKDRQKVKHLFVTCEYNSLHFILRQDYDTHEIICGDKAEIKRMVRQLRLNFQAAKRQRERSREKVKKEEGQEIIKKAENQEQHDQDQTTLSDCQECKQLLSQMTLQMSGNPKLMKYLKKYEQVSKNRYLI